MKNKIMLILIAILTFISIVLGIVVINYKSNYVRIPKQYKCESEIMSMGDGKATRQQIIILNINKEQYVENYQNKNITIYTDNDTYETIKSNTNADGVSYSVDDKKKTIISTFPEKNIEDEEGNKTNIWYKDYINNLESSGYHCEIIK